MLNYNNKFRMVYNKMYCKRSVTVTRYAVNLAIVHIQLQLETGLSPFIDCTAVRPQFNDQNRTTVQSAYQHYNLPIFRQN